ncbi:plasmid replication protein RepC [Methylobacterium sp. JK268]
MIADESPRAGASPPLTLTTPFGRRPLTAAQVTAQVAGDNCPSDAIANKWTVLRDLTAARERLGLSAQTLAVLEALLSFHPETALVRGSGADLVVFPSNAALGQRTRGLSETSLRRHLGALAEAGILIRRDSPNGKRYARRDASGEITHAYGFDLSPLVARAAEFAALADEVRAVALALRIARERLTLLRRDCAKLIEALDSRGGEAPAAECRLRYAALLGRLPRRRSLADLTAAGDAMEVLVRDVSKRLIERHDSEDSDGRGSRNERHIHNSNPNDVDSERAPGTEKKDAGAPGPASEPLCADIPTVRTTYPLGFVLATCPDIRMYARNDIRTWADLIDTADQVRAAMGISPHAWREAKTEMGDEAAAITVAAILQRVDRIRSPGGYLRSLVERKKAGRFSLGPVLQALNQARLETGRVENR